MPSSKTSRRIAAIATAILFALTLGACTMSPRQLAYRDRLEMGFVTAEDSERFKTSEREQQALTADARSIRSHIPQTADLQLIEMAATGDATRITALLADGAQVNAIDAKGQTALWSAARAGEVENARVLIKAGAYVDGRGGTMSPLAAAALGGHAAVVRLLIRHGANVDAVGENGLSPLMNAVKLNRLSVAKILIEAGANTYSLDRVGDDLLVVAITENHAEMLALLLEKGVEPDRPDSNGLTALYWAEYLNRPKLALRLREAGANPSRKKTERLVSQPYNFGEF